MNVDLELEKAVNEIKKTKAKTVCIQLPDGLKPEGKEIQQYLKKHTDARILLWAGSCFGACDIPLEVERLGVDLLIQWGHTPFQ